MPTIRSHHFISLNKVVMPLVTVPSVRHVVLARTTQRHRVYHVLVLEMCVRCHGVVMPIGVFSRTHMPSLLRACES